MLQFPILWALVNIVLNLEKLSDYRLLKNVSAQGSIINIVRVRVITELEI